MNTPYYEETATGTALPTDKLQLLSRLAEAQGKAEQECAVAEAALKRANEALAEISERQIPLLMDELGMAEFTTTTGLKVKVAEAIRASIPKARQEEAVTWLDAHGFQNLVKRKFTILFSKDEEAWAKKFMRDLEQRKKQLNVEEDQSVHSKTLSAFVKERLEAGEELPLELFGVFRQRYSKIEVRK